MRQAAPRRSRRDDGRGDLAESPEPKGRKAPKVAGQIETPHPPDLIMRRPWADREEKRVTYGNYLRHEGEKQLDADNYNQRRIIRSGKLMKLFYRGLASTKPKFQAIQYICCLLSQLTLLCTRSINSRNRTQKTSNFVYKTSFNI